MSKPQFSELSANEELNYINWECAVTARTLLLRRSRPCRFAL